MNYWAIGFMAGILLALLVVLILFIVRGSKAKTTYDERQTLARNAAYKYAYFTLLIYCAVCMMLDAFDVKWATTYVQMVLGIILSVCIFAILCIVKGAYDGLNTTNRRASLFLFFIIAATNLFVFIMNVVDGDPMLTDGMLNNNFINLPIAVPFLSVGIAQLVKRRMDQKSEAEE